MSIEYSILDVLIVIKKRWFIVLGAALICLLVAKPLSDKSYESAMQSYVEKQNSLSVKEKYCKGDLETYVYINSTGAKDDELTETLISDMVILAGRIKNPGIAITYYQSIDALCLWGTNLSQEDVDKFIDEWSKKIDQVLLSRIDKKVKVDFEEAVVEMQETPEPEPDFLLKEPVKSEIGLRVYATATVFGILLGLVIVMAWDYAICCKKIKQAEEAA